jgi:hypothetical protein
MIHDRASSRDGAPSRNLQGAVRRAHPCRSVGYSPTQCTVALSSARIASAIGDWKRQRSNTMKLSPLRCTAADVELMKVQLNTRGRASPVTKWKLSLFIVSPLLQPAAHARSFQTSHPHYRRAMAGRWRFGTVFVVWRAPAEVWRAPAEVWRAPAEVWRAPAEVWRAPAEGWRAPADAWRAPAEVWRAPAEVWRAPADVWRAPADVRRTSANRRRTCFSCAASLPIQPEQIGEDQFIDFLALLDRGLPGGCSGAIESPPCNARLYWGLSLDVCPSVSLSLDVPILQ